MPVVEDTRKEAKRREALARASFPDRLRYACEMAGHTKPNGEIDRAWLAGRLGISSAAVGQVINGKIAMNAYNTAMAARELGCNSHWLATGEEQPSAPAMIRQPPSAEELHKVQEIERLDEAEQLRVLSEIYHSLSLSSKELLLTEAVRIAEAQKQSDAFMRQKLGMNADPDKPVGATLPRIDSTEPRRKRAAKKTQK